MMAKQTQLVNIDQLKANVVRVPDLAETLPIAQRDDKTVESGFRGTTDQASGPWSKTHLAA